MAKTEKFCIEVNFLTSRYIATCHNDRQRPEWPPHPARLFSALVATWADADEPAPSEREALAWLEAQGHPAIATSDAVPRKVVSHFVPVNDTSIISRAWQNRKADKIEPLAKQYHQELVDSGGELTKTATRLWKKISKERDIDAQVTKVGNTNRDSAMQMLPERRSKQERFFPSVTPEEARVTYIWYGPLPDGINEVLDRLLSRVTRLGHSSSLVSCQLSTNPIAPTHVPREDGIESLRSIRRGQLAELERQFARHRESRPRSLPYTEVRYQPASEILEAGRPWEPDTTGDWIVFEFAHGSRTLPATRAAEIASTMRSAIMHYAEEPVPEGISGHTPEGGSTMNPHVAFLPLPYVGFKRADGRLLGMAVSVPKGLTEVTRRALFRAIGAWEDTRGLQGCLRLTFGSRGVVQMSRQYGLATLFSLRPKVWNRCSDRWVSATPIALPKHPGHLCRGTASARAKAWLLTEAAVVAACHHVGLPKPSTVQVSLTSFITGGRDAGDFPPFIQSGQNRNPIRRQLVHALLTFESAVSGPMVLGAGRFLGLGLMRPLPAAPQGDSYKNNADE